MTAAASLQIVFHYAHKARLARIATAAALHNERKQRAEQRQLAVRQEHDQRRAYEIARRVKQWTPLTSRILKAVADEYGLTVDDLTGRSQKGPVCQARFVAVGLLVEMTNMSFPAIGRRLNRDHTTILNARRQARKLFASEAFRNRVDQIKREVA